MISSFPVDSTSVRLFGIERWEQECSWPVAEKEFTALCDRIEQVYADYVNGRSEIIGNAMLVKRTLVVEYWHLLHAMIVLERLRHSNRQPLCAATTPWYRQLIDGTLLAFPNGVIGRTIAAEASWRRWVNIARMKRVAWTTYLNFTTGKSLRSRTGEQFSTIGVPSDLVRSFLDPLPGRVSVTAGSDWWSARGSSASHDVSLRRDFREAGAEIARALHSIASTHGVELTDDHHRYLAQMTERQLVDAAIALRTIDMRRVTRRGAHLVLHAPGDQVGRALALAFRASGMPVTSVAHGGTLGFFDSPSMAVNEFAVSDEFVTATLGSARLFERILAAHPPLRGSRVRITPGAFTGYREVWERYRSAHAPQTIRRVMLVGSSFAPWRRPQGSGQFPMYILNVEVAIIRTLRALGYEVWYKAHPDRIPEAVAVFDGDVRIIGGEVRDHLDTIDAFVFSTIRTTAFAYVLCTNKPVIGFVVEPDRFPLHSDVRDLLARRCALIPLQFNGQHRLVFDPGALGDALSQDPHAPDASFIERYLLPSLVSS